MSKKPMSLKSLIARLRDDFRNGADFVVLYAYNGTGKTRVSMAFKEVGKKALSRPMTCEDHVEQPLVIEDFERDTLYFNAFTEDLFNWDNDLEHDAQRVLRINQDSRFFDGLRELEMETRIKSMLDRYADFGFKIDYDNWTVHFNRDVVVKKRGQDTVETIEHIKVSRGEENVFIWCFFLAIVQLVIDKQEGSAYDWVKYIYIDDPISSLDDNNAIAVAVDLVKLLKQIQGNVKVVISSHHSLFFNVLTNEFKRGLREGQFKKYFLTRPSNRGVPMTDQYQLQDTGDTPFFYHVSMLKELKSATGSGKLYTYHFNMMRSIMEKTASFFGQKDFSFCIKGLENEAVFLRALNLLSHGGYSLFEPQEMLQDNKDLFTKIFNQFLERFEFVLSDEVVQPQATQPIEVNHG